MSREERRSERRYPIRQPAFVKFQAEERGEVEAVVQNVSAHGLLLRCETPIPIRSKVEVTLCFPNARPLVGAGEVLRVDQPAAVRGFLIAVRCEAPWEFLR
jgi:hypothetical protein